MTKMTIKTTTLPAIIAGPILRHVEVKQITLWLVTSKAYQLRFKLYDQNNSLLVEQILTDDNLQQIPIGKHAYINLVTIKLTKPLPTEQQLNYDIQLINADVEQGLTELIADLNYDEQTLPHFVIKQTIATMLHGSCRKPHFDSDDGLTAVDDLLVKLNNEQDKQASIAQRPAMLMMSGDQIYADDVAGPMLVAIHQVIKLLGLFDENFDGAVVDSSQTLFESPLCYYQRQHLLPHTSANKAVYDKIFAASKKPIFTSDNANNHLVTLSEVFAMYFLVWSPTLWALVDLDKPNINEEFTENYRKELLIINEFSAGLARVRRAMAHLPVYMIFDDHDITDDWNLTRGWEESAYGHPFSKQIIGNTLIGYWLCQGWGNAPKKFNTFNQQQIPLFTENGITQKQQSSLIDGLLNWDQWHYHLATSPKVVVLDTRTHRWRSESKACKPSGLMDWEALSELQQELINEPSVIMVSPAPIYGVKMIETVQRIFTFFGKPLMVDAENWMTHSGTANVMLNIFRHVKTPPNFIILSGDVHYSFVYEVTHRFSRSSAKILQITCSGLKNQFPASLLNTLDRLNQLLYGRFSPLNWFTKRRRMKIKERTPSAGNSKSLFNGSGIGQLTLSNNNDTIETKIIIANGQEDVYFR
jgi:hypothetical protein